MVLARTAEFSERLAAGTVTTDAVVQQRGFIVGVTETLRALDLLTADEWTEWATRLLVLTHRRPSSADLVDPAFAPPLDINATESRRYEETILRKLEQDLVGQSVGARSVRGIRLRGERPRTEILFDYHDSEERADRTWTFAVWESGYPTADAEFTGALESPAEVAGAICTDWSTDYWARGTVTSASAE
jgi:hypothetical protein